MRLKNPITAIAISIFILLTCYHTARAGSPQFVKNFNVQQPFSFEENKGQLADEKGNVLKDILYYGWDNSSGIFCFKDKIAFVFKKTTSKGNLSRKTNPIFKGANHNDSVVVTAVRMEMCFIGANPELKVIAEQPQAEYNNYYLAHCPDGITANSFNKIIYKNIYPDIDLVLVARDKGMEYSFIVYPGGDVNSIRMQWNGVDSIYYKPEEGRIKYISALGYLQEGKLKTYLQDGSKIQCQYHLNNKQLGFTVGHYPATEILTIDPYINWYKTFGDSGNESSVSIAPDVNGDVYITGSTDRKTGIASFGAYQSAYSGNGDIFISAYSLGGKHRWSTYYGTASKEDAGGIAVDKSNNIYITGYTQSSTGLASSGAFQTKGGGAEDVFIARFSSTGKLSWSTYFGGAGSDMATDIALDDSAHVILTGKTLTYGYPVGSATGTGSTYNAFISKFSSLGKYLWSRTDGSGYNTYGLGVTVDHSYNIYLTGQVQSPGMATSGAYSSGTYSLDAFLSKFSRGGKKTWCTYFGGFDVDAGTDVITDSKGNIYITGYTQSTSGIASTGAFQTSLANNTTNAFLAKFSSSGSFNWGTYYGGNSFTQSSGIAVDSSDNVIITGPTNSSSGLATTGAFQTSVPPSSSAFYLATFSSLGQQKWASYYGVPGSEYVSDRVITDPFNNIFLAGTFEKYIPGADTYAFLSQISSSYNNDAGIPLILYPKGTFCSSDRPVQVVLRNFGRNELDSVQINWALNNKIQSPYKWTGKLKMDSATTVTLPLFHFTPGNYNVKIWSGAPNGTKDSSAVNDTAWVKDSVLISPAPHIGGNRTVCSGDTITFSVTPVKGHTYFWASYPDSFISRTTNPTFWPIVRKTTFLLTETDPVNGCSKTDTAIISVTPSPLANTGKAQAICIGDSVQVGAPSIKGHSYNWTSMPAGFYSKISGPVVKPFVTTTYYLTESNDSSGCRRTDSVIVTVNSYPLATTGPNTTICEGDSFAVGTTAIKGHSYHWTSKPAGFTSQFSSIVVRPKTSTIYYLQETNDLTGCSKIDSVFIKVNPLPSGDAGKSVSICSEDPVAIGNPGNPAYSYHWTSKPKGFISTLANPIVKPAKTNSYFLTISDNSTGCVKTDSVTITVYPRPMLAGYSAYLDLCKNVVHTISQAKDTNNYKYQWRLSKGKNISTPDTNFATFLWDKQGLDTVWAVAENSYGCKDSARYIINIHNKPDGRFRVHGHAMTFEFVANDTSYLKYKWNFGDNSAIDSSGGHVFHTFADSQNYKVSLFEQSGIDCFQSSDSVINSKSGLAEPAISEMPKISIYPNPFSNSTTIAYTLDKASQVDIKITDIQGRAIATLVQGYKPSGQNTTEFRVETYHCPAGIYLVKVVIAGESSVNRIVKVE